MKAHPLIDSVRQLVLLKDSSEQGVQLAIKVQVFQDAFYREEMDNKKEVTERCPVLTGDKCAKGKYRGRCMDSCYRRRLLCGVTPRDDDLMASCLCSDAKEGTRFLWRGCSVW